MSTSPMHGCRGARRRRSASAGPTAMRSGCWLKLAASLALAGCATLDEPFRAYLDAPSRQVRDCATWYVALDRAVDEAGVRDAQQTRVPGFPYLRVDRLLASLRNQVSQALDV